MALSTPNSYRLFERLDLPPGTCKYDVSRECALAKTGPDAEQLNEWHALIVRHGQRIDRRSNPRCKGCPPTTPPPVRPE